MQPTTITPHRYPAAQLQSFAAQVFERHGMNGGDARAAAQSLVRSDMRGWRTHGLARLASYAQMIDERLCNPAPNITHESRPGALIVEADGALGHVAARDILALATREMESAASLLVVAREIGHLGALGIHALAAAEAGLFCMMGQYTPPLLAMPGFQRAAIGNNPLAFGCPMPGGEPLVFDMASSKAARGHVLLAAREGRAIPEGWAVDAQGQPTTDAKKALQGALLPAADAKGMGLAMMVQVLAGSLSATAESVKRPPPVPREGGGTSRVGAFFWFVNPAAFAGRDVFEESMRQWTGHYVGSSDSGAARLPGARGGGLEEKAGELGVEVSAAVEKELRKLGEKWGMPWISPSPSGTGLG